MSFLLSSLDELFLCFAEAITQSNSGVGWERIIFYDEMVQIITQIVGALRAAMPVVDSKKGALRPVVDLLARWLHYIENYGDSVFVVVAKGSERAPYRIIPWFVLAA